MVNQHQQPKQKHKQAPRFTQEQEYRLELGRQYNEILVERNAIEERRMEHAEQLHLRDLKRAKNRKNFFLSFRVKGPLLLVVAMGLTSFLAKIF